MAKDDDNIGWIFLGAAVIGGIFALGNNKETVTTLVSKFLYPVYGKITSTYGNRINPVTKQAQFHNGIDISGNVGDLIRSPSDGVVQSQYYNSAGGNQMIIKHTNGFTSGYAHLNKYLVKHGDKVTRGQAIAEVGKTGQVTGPHLHFTLRDTSGNTVNPVNYLV